MAFGLGANNLLNPVFGAQQQAEYGPQAPMNPAWSAYYGRPAQYNGQPPGPAPAGGGGMGLTGGLDLNGLNMALERALNPNVQANVGVGGGYGGPPSPPPPPAPSPAASAAVTTPPPASPPAAPPLPAATPPPATPMPPPAQPAQPRPPAPQGQRHGGLALRLALGRAYGRGNANRGGANTQAGMQGGPAQPPPRRRLGVGLGVNTGLGGLNANLGV